LAPLIVGKSTLAAAPFALAVFAAAIIGHTVGSREDGLRALSSVDVLTGLFNRRHFEDCMKREVARAMRHHSPLALLVVDVDGLKAINDRYGHGAGDRAICAVADAL